MTAAVSRWVELNSDGYVALHVGKVEFGQGISTSLAQIGAEELDVSWSRVRVVPVSTVDSPDEGYTSGSRSIMEAGFTLRTVCAQARRLLIEAAAVRCQLPASRLSVVDGDICDDAGNVQITYWDFAGSDVLDRPVDPDALSKTPQEYRLVGKSQPRLDLERKFAGAPSFIHDLSLPGQLFGRVLRPPSQGAKITAVDDAAIRARPAVVDVVRSGDFIGVIASREDEAIRAAELLRARVTWSQRDDILPEQQELPDYLQRQPTKDSVIMRRDDAAAVGRVVTSIESRYTRPYIAHASIAPGCGVARWSDDGSSVTVWSHTQGVYPLRRGIAVSLGLDEDAIVVNHVDGAGCYGHNSADDAAFDAVLLARAVPGRPVQVVWSRDDDLTWDPFGPAMVAKLSVGVDAAGNIMTWHHDVWGSGHMARPGAGGRHNLLAGKEIAGEPDVIIADDPPPSRGEGTGRSAASLYDIPDVDIVSHCVLTPPLRSSSMRSLGAMLNVFATESMMDELATHAGADPLEYRLRHLSDERARAVLEAAAEQAGWSRRQAGESDGWGIAFSRYKNYCAYCAVVAHVEAVSDVKVRELFVAVDAGQVINPDGLINQVEGGAIQATSWAVCEEVRFDRRVVTTRDWETYPILRFSDVPKVTVSLLMHQDEPPLGVGEIAVGPVAAAIGNALGDALGVRIRDLPFTAERLVATMLAES
jgi:CO/xanthine dehydrogenase Mo-binding subunit